MPVYGSSVSLFQQFGSYVLQDIITMYHFRIQIISQRIIECKFFLSLIQPFSPFICFLNFFNRFYQLIKEMSDKIRMGPEVNMECIEILFLKTEIQFYFYNDILFLNLFPTPWYLLHNQYVTCM